MNYNWEFRQLSATTTSLTFPRIPRNTYVIWGIEVKMVSLEPHFYASVKDTLTIEWITWDTVNELNNVWTVQSYPVLYFLFKTWLASITDVSFEMGWYTIEINETISDSDILVIDAENKEVTLNWVDIDYDWPLPVLEVWANSFDLEFTPASTVSMDLIAIYKKNYL